MAVEQKYIYPNEVKSFQKKDETYRYLSEKELHAGCLGEGRILGGSPGHQGDQSSPTECKRGRINISQGETDG